MVANSTNVNGSARPFDLDILDCKQLADFQDSTEYLIEDVLVKGEPCMVGAPKKSMKTSLMVEMGVSIVSGEKFLNRFQIHETKHRVLMLSGEGGKPTLRSTFLRVCDFHGVKPEHIREHFLFGFNLPRLGNDLERNHLGKFVKDREINVVIIDPLYLCLMGGGLRIDPSNLFEMGPHLRMVNEVVSPATLILVHHFKKGMLDGRYGQPDLDDLAWSGFSEFARQWILLKRAERYVPGTGKHKLWMAVGGSAGHSDEWVLDIDEGTPQAEGGRKWSVEVTDGDAFVAGKGEAKVVEDAHMLADACTEPMTPYKLQYQATGKRLSKEKFQPMFAKALELKLLEPFGEPERNLFRKTPKYGVIPMD